MDFQRLNRRELQSLCKLNKIPANITNVAMADALSALPFVEGIEEFLMAPSSQMSETADSSIESPEKTEVMSPRVPRTSCRTSTRQKPLTEHATETLQTATRTTARRTRKAPAASARSDMKIQLKESGGDEKVEEDSKHLEKKCVPETPSAVPNSRRKGPAASTRRTTALKEESMFERTYSTRRSARLKEKTVAEPTLMEKERGKPDKVDSVSDEKTLVDLVSDEKTLSFSEKLDEGSDDFNAVVENSNIPGFGHNAVTVGMEGGNELLELGKDKTNAHTDTHTEGTSNMDVKVDALERSYKMAVDVIPSDNGNPTEFCKFNSLENITLVKDVDSEGTIAVDTQVELQENSGKTDIGVEVHPSEQEDPCKIFDLGTVENISSSEDMGSVDTTSALMEDGDALDKKEADSTESEILKMGIMENVGTFEEMDSHEKTEQDMESVFVENNGIKDIGVEVHPSGQEDPCEILDLLTVENISSCEDMGSVDTTSAEMEVGNVLDKKGAESTENSSETPKMEIMENPCEILDLLTVENISSCEDMGSVDTTSAEMEVGNVLDKKGAESTENSSETPKMEIMENVGIFEEMDSDEKIEQDMESGFKENNAEAVSSRIGKPNEPEPLLDDAESKGQANILSDLLKMSAYAAQDQNQDFELPEPLPIEETIIGFAAEEMSSGSVESANGDAKQESFNLVGSDSKDSLDLTEHLLSGQVGDEKVADVTETHTSKQVTESVDESAMDISEADAIPTQVPPSKTPLKKSASKTPANSRRMAFVSDDKENIDRSGKISQPAKDVGKKIKKEKGENDMLYDASLRQLTKMLKEKLQITNGVKTIEEEEETNITKQVATTRPALQTLSSNSLASN